MKILLWLRLAPSLLPRAGNSAPLTLTRATPETAWTIPEAPPPVPAMPAGAATGARDRSPLWTIHAQGLDARAGIWAAVMVLIALLERLLDVHISVDHLRELGAGSRVVYATRWSVMGVSAACSAVLCTSAWKNWRRWGP